MQTCAVKPSDPRAQVQLVGNDLISNYGKKDHYSVEEVKAANARQSIGIDVACWSHAVFNSHHDFDDYHRSIGEACDYAAMKTEMLEAVSSASDVSWFDIDLSWLQFPDIDLSLFDFL